MHLTVIRHAQSESNRQGRWQGHGDTALSAAGRAQVAALGRRLGELPYDVVISSDLQRARETAEGLGRPVRTYPRWRELDLGRWEGLTMAEVIERYPEEAARLHAGEDIAVGGGERWSDLGRRIADAFDDLVETHRGARVALVAHGGVVLTLLEGLLGVAGERPRRLGRVLNTAVAELDVERRLVLRYNDATHLGAAWAEPPRPGESVVSLRPEPGAGVPLEALAFAVETGGIDAGEPVDVTEASADPDGAWQFARERARGAGARFDFAPWLPGRGVLLSGKPHRPAVQAWNAG